MELYVFYEIINLILKSSLILAGVLRVTCDLSKQIKRDWLLNVSATDSQHFADVMTVSLKVTPKITGRSKGGVAIDCKKLDVTDRYMQLLSLGNSRNKVNANNVETTPPRKDENWHSPEFLSTIPSEVWINESAPVGSEVWNMNIKTFLFKNR